MARRRNSTAGRPAPETRGKSAGAPGLLGPGSAVGPLRIKQIRVRVLQARLDDPVLMSFSSLPVRQTLLVEVHSQGLVGVGESWVNYPPWAWVERVATLREGVAPLLVGADAADIGALHRRLVTELAPLGRQWGAPGPIWQAISGVDLALWDLVGQATARPVAALLARQPRAEVPVYASGVGPDSVGQLTERALSQGFTALKIRVGFGQDRDLATLREVRRAAPGMRVFADANQAWTPDEAARTCDLFREYGVEWCEEPIRGNSLSDLERLHERTEMPLATGENVYTVASFARFTASPAISQIQPDVSKTGGLTVALAVADMARDNAASVSPHCYTGAVTLAASAQLAAARPEVAWVELDIRDNPLRTTLTRKPFELVDGRLKVPDGAGLGIALDDEQLHRYDVDR